MAFRAMTCRDGSFDPSHLDPLAALQVGQEKSFIYDALPYLPHLSHLSH